MLDFLINFSFVIFIIWVVSRIYKERIKVYGINLFRKIGGDKGKADIPASQQTINVTPLGSDSPVKSSGGSGDAKIVQDISIIFGLIIFSIFASQYGVPLSGL